MTTLDQASETATSSALVTALEAFRTAASDTEIQTVIVFLLIARKPGIRMKEIEKAVGLSASAVSRNVLMLSSRSYNKDPVTKQWADGLDLVVTASDPFDTRAKVVTITPRGRRLYEKMVTPFFKPPRSERT